MSDLTALAVSLLRNLGVNCRAAGACVFFEEAQRYVMAAKILECPGVRV